ncbi:hypothetical protein Aduo_009841 [Ancylostoma duodenale]
MDRVREGVEANHQTALLRAERKGKKADVDAQLERRINAGLSRDRFRCVTAHFTSCSRTHPDDRVAGAAAARGRNDTWLPPAKRSRADVH